MPAPGDHLDLEPRASDFLELLRDLGHLDEGAMERLSDELLRSRPPGASPVISYEDARRAAAALLFDGEGKMRPEARELLGAEWLRLFA